MPIRFLIALGVLLCGAASAAAQAYDTSYALAPRSRCVVPDSQMVRVPVYAWVDLPDSVASSYRAAAENLLQDVAIQVRTLLGAAPNVLPPGEPAVRWFDLDVPLAVTARRNGRTSWRAAERGDTAAAGLLGRALGAALAGGSVFLWDSTMARDSVRFRIALAWPKVLGGKRTAPPDVKHTALAVFSIDYPPVAHAVPTPGNRAPRYPEDARDRGYTATVVMRFVVDTSGHAVMSTIRDVWAADKPPLTEDQALMYGEFREAVRVALAGMRFLPAEVGKGCLIDEVVQMPCEFKLAQ